MFNFKLSHTVKKIQWSFISLATVSFSHLLLRIFLGKELGPNGLGIYTLAFTIYLFGMQFAAFGIGSALIKYVAEFGDEHNKVKEYVSAGFAGSLISGFMMGAILYLASNFIANSIFHIVELTEILHIIAFCLPFIAIQKMVLGTLNGLGKMQLYAFVNILQNVSVLILSAFFVFTLNAGVKGAIYGLVLPTIMTSLISIILIKDLFWLSSFTFINSIKNVTWCGFYVVLANSIGMVNTQVDSLMVGHFMEAASVGYYAVAIIIVQGITLIPNSVHTAIAPSIAYYYGKFEYQKTITLIEKTMVKIFVVIIFFSLSLVLFGKSLIVLMFTNDFIVAYHPLLILLVGYSIYSPVHSVDCALLGIGKVNLLYKIALICAIFNIILNAFLIPKYEIIGAAISTTISIVLMATFKLYYINKYILKFKNISHI